MIISIVMRVLIIPVLKTIALAKLTLKVHRTIAFLIAHNLESYARTEAALSLKVRFFPIVVILFSENKCPDKT